MKAHIDRSRIAGQVIAPASKSYTIRGLMCAALAGGGSQIVNPLSAEDTEAASRVLAQVGVGVLPDGYRWRISGGALRQSDAELFCGESAATLRFMTAICALVPGQSRLTAGPSLARRPVEPLIEALRQLGVDCAARAGAVPVEVKGGGLRGGLTTLPGDVSSQFVSALLLISPLAPDGVKIRLTTPLESKSYVLMTLECLKAFGIAVDAAPTLDEFEIISQVYQPAIYKVEGDWSSASYFLALGAVADGVEVANLNPASLQGDRVMLDLLRDMGAVVEVKPDSIAVRKSRLRGIRADLSNCIDLLPTMAVLAAEAEGVSQFVGIERARLKESNRVAAVKEGLERMGVEVGEAKDTLTVVGTGSRGAVIDSHDDHRIAMAFSILGALTGDTVIDGAECVNKTFPRFWDILRSIGGEVVVYGE
jgi:3-phosphoshikimate 1-carboxyvinyltransferase